MATTGGDERTSGRMSGGAGSDTFVLNADDVIRAARRRISTDRPRRSSV
jgi:hypothetical protein